MSEKKHLSLPFLLLSKYHCFVVLSLFLSTNWRIGTFWPALIITPVFREIGGFFSFAGVSHFTSSFNLLVGCSSFSDYYLTRGHLRATWDQFALICAFQPVSRITRPALYLTWSRLRWLYLHIFLALYLHMMCRNFKKKNYIEIFCNLASSLFLRVFIGLSVARLKVNTSSYMVFLIFDTKVLLLILIVLIRKVKRLSIPIHEVLVLILSLNVCQTNTSWFWLWFDCSSSCLRGFENRGPVKRPSLFCRYYTRVENFNDFLISWLLKKWKKS